MRIGSLCTGYGGLDMAAQAVLGGETAWVSDIDKGANKLLAHRYPDVPNLGDFTCTDWSAVEPVDVLTAGFPCQPVSHAGKRLGTNDERWLWDDVARAVRELRPGLVLLENVRGLLTAGGGRLFGRVVGALADLGYDAQWHGLRAADVGAPHGRWRVFIVATPADNHGGRQQGVRRLISVGRDADRRGGADGAGRAAEPAALLPTPVADNSRGLPSSGTDYASLPNALVALLPTPAVNDMGEGKTAEAWDEWTARMKAAHGNGNGHGASLAIEAQRLLPTPSVADSTGGHLSRSGDRSGELLLPGVAKEIANGGATEGRPSEGLRGVRDATDAQAVRQREARGSDGVPQAEVLLAELREHAPGGQPVGPQLAGEGVPQADVRGVRDDGAAALASRRPELAQRRPEQPADPVCLMPSAAALAGGQGGPCGCGTSWGQYEAAVRRWEQVLGRCAPPPTEMGPKGNPRLSARFSEFLMGLPAGWITDVPGVTRNEALKLAGNGVVPQQAEAALRLLLGVMEVAA